MIPKFSRITEWLNEVSPEKNHYWMSLQNHHRNGCPQSAKPVAQTTGSNTLASMFHFFSLRLPLPMDRLIDLCNGMAWWSEINWMIYNADFARSRQWHEVRKWPAPAIYPSIINVSLTTTKTTLLTSGLILESAYEEYPEVVFYFLNLLRLNGNGMSWSLVLRFRNWPKSSMQNIIYIPIFLYFPIFSYGKSVNPPCLSCLSQGIRTWQASSCASASIRPPPWATSPKRHANSWASDAAGRVDEWMATKKKGVPSGNLT